MAEVSPDISRIQIGLLDRPVPVSQVSPEGDQLATVVSFCDRRASKIETANRAQAMRDIARYTLIHCKVSRHNIHHPSNDRVFALLWGIKDVILPTEPVNYLRPNIHRAYDLHNNVEDRTEVSYLVNAATAENITQSAEALPWIRGLGEYVSGRCEQYKALG